MELKQILLLSFIYLSIVLPTIYLDYKLSSTNGFKGVSVYTTILTTVIFIILYSTYVEKQPCHSEYEKVEGVFYKKVNK